MKLKSLLLFVATMATLDLFSAEDEFFTLSESELGYELKTPDGRTVFQYMTKVPSDGSLDAPSACCLYPYYTPSGVPVGDIAPEDHEHHRGIFMGFVSVSSAKARADFWGWGEWAPRIERVIENISIELTDTSNKSATISVQNKWRVRKAHWFDEFSVFTVSEGDGFYTIDCEYRTVAKQELVLDQKAFGGLGVRMRSDGKQSVHDKDGLVTRPKTRFFLPDGNWPGPWLRYELDCENGDKFGVTIAEHPDNPPTSWFKIGTRGLISPSITAKAEIPLKPEDEVVQRYRIIVQDEDANSTQVATAREVYLNGGH